MGIAGPGAVPAAGPAAGAGNDAPGAAAARPSWTGRVVISGIDGDSTFRRSLTGTAFVAADGLGTCSGATQSSVVSPAPPDARGGSSGAAGAAIRCDGDEAGCDVTGLDGSS